MSSFTINLGLLERSLARGKKKRLSEGPLTHYTLNSGAHRELHRRPLSRRTEATLWDLALRGGGEFAGVLSAFGCRVEPAMEVGGRTFWILRNEDPVLLCVVCWSVASAVEQLGIAERVYYDLLLQDCVETAAYASRDYQHAPQLPGPVPWLACVQCPRFHLLDPREEVVIDELERCMAWTLLSRSLAVR